MGKIERVVFPERRNKRSIVTMDFDAHILPAILSQLQHSKFGRYCLFPAYVSALSLPATQESPSGQLRPNKQPNTPQ